MKLREQRDEVAARTPDNAIGRAYQQYVLDSRLDTDEDDEAFSDAIFQHIIEPFERQHDSLSDRIHDFMNDMHASIEDGRNDLDNQLGL